MRNPFIEITQNLDESKCLVGAYHPNNQIERVYAELKEKLDDNTLQVMLYGAYNAGKSTLINALIGQEKATVNDIPTTDTVDYYDWQRTLKLRRRKSDLLAHGNRGGTMINSQGKKRHAVCVFASVSIRNVR